jgi:hypothetical protein
MLLAFGPKQRYPHQAMHMTDLSLMRFFGIAKIAIGLIWLRRAYIGEKSGILLTLRPSLERAMSRRERVIALFFGGAFLLMGLVQLMLRPN